MNNVYAALCGLVIFAAPQVPSNILLRISLIVGGCGLILQLLSQRKIVVGRSELALLVFVLWTSITILWSNSEREGYQLFIDLLGVLMCFYMYSWARTTRAQMLRYGWIYLAGCIISSLLVIKNWNAGIGFEDTERFSVGDYINTNYVAYALAFGFSIACYFISIAKNDRISIITSFFTSLVCLQAILLTGSRGALISCLISVALVANIIVKRSNIKKAIINIVVACMVILAMIAIPEEFLSRFKFDNYDEGGAGYSSGRIDMWKIALEHSGNLLLGQGYDSFGVISGLYVNPHNIFISLLFEIGLIGTILYLLSLWFFIKPREFEFNGDRIYILLPVYLFVGWIPIVLTGVWGLSPITWLVFSWARSVSAGK